VPTTQKKNLVTIGRLVVSTRNRKEGKRGDVNRQTRGKSVAGEQGRELIQPTNNRVATVRMKKKRNIESRPELFVERERKRWTNVHLLPAAMLERLIRKAIRW